MTNQESPQSLISPLSEADPLSLEEIFNKAPPYSEAEMTIIVKELRRQRELWEQAEASGAKRAPKNAPKTKANATLKLEDLDLPELK